MIGHHEHVRYRHAYSDCNEQHMADHELLRRDVCCNYEDRIMFKEAVDCEGAEKRLRLSVVMCALTKWVKESNLSNMLDTLTGSYWALFITVMTPVLFAMYLYKSQATELAIMEKLERYAHKKRRRKQPKAISKSDTAVCYK